MRNLIQGILLNKCKINGMTSDDHTSIGVEV
jgi:hypothetical protein